MAKVPIDVRVDDIVRLRKPHPCGSYEWRVVRIGADIGLKCLTCGRRVLLPRRTFERRLKSFVARAVQVEGQREGRTVGEAGSDPQDTGN